MISLSAGVAEAIVLHPDAEPDMQSWTDRPHIDVLARWGINASCVVIAPNYIITVQHQGGGTHTPVVVAGNTYSIAEIWNHSDADLRIARLDNADLQQYVGLCGLRDEPGRDIAMAGFGDGREYELKTDDITYGYSWDNSSNTTLRWGTNRIEATEDQSELGDWISDVVLADFDEPCYAEPNDYECALADHDSGGGWFVKIDGQWKLAGLSRTVEHGEESWFRDKEDPNYVDPDYFDGVRVSSYVNWIAEIVPLDCRAEKNGDTNADCLVNIEDLAAIGNNWLREDCGAENENCFGADFEPDGDVDIADMAVLVQEWLSVRF